MRSLFPTTDVRAENGNIRSFKSELQDISPVRFRSFDGRSVSVGDWIWESYTDGLLVLKGDSIVTEFYANDFAPDVPHLGQSVSKSLVGTLAGILHGEGLFDLSQPLEDIVPELANSGYAGCTVDQALDMLSGALYCRSNIVDQISS